MYDRAVSAEPAAHPGPAIRARDVRTSALVALGYYAGCLIGFALRFPASGIAYLWPPTAILLISLLLLKPRAWSMILGGTLAAHGIAHAQDQVPTFTWLWLFLADASQAVLAASIVLTFSRRPLRCSTLRDLSVFVGGAALAAPAIASLLASPVYTNLGWAGDSFSAWGMRTLSNAITTLTLVPPLIALFGADPKRLAEVRLDRGAEFVALLLGVIAVNFASFALANSAPGGLSPALYGCMPFLAWAATRFGIPGLSVCLLATAYLAINCPGLQSPSAGAWLLQTIVDVQMFVGMAGTPLMFLSVLLENRRARRTGQALLDGEVRSAALLKAIPDLIFVQSGDAEHRYLDYHARAASELLVPPEEFLGKPMRDVLPPDLARSFEDLFHHATVSSAPQILEYSLPLRGEQRHYEARVVACDDGRLLSIVRDDSARTNAETALQQARQALARLNRASPLGEVAASIAHEVQQPLSAISTNAAVCLRRLREEAHDSRQLDEALVDILEDAARASQVIRRTRELFNGTPGESAAVELNSAILEVLALVRTRADLTGQSVRAETANSDLIVIGNRVQLQQVLVNLVMNALEAMRAVTDPNRAVSLRSWREEGLIHVAVRDSGAGFDPGEIERIFDPFYTTKPDGLGIGLSISRSIIQAHGGRLEATLNPGGGATFEFTLPAAS